MHRQIILLTGAPTTEQLDWSEDVLSKTSTSIASGITTSSTTYHSPKWRLISHVAQRSQSSSELGIINNQTSNTCNDEDHAYGPEALEQTELFLTSILGTGYDSDLSTDHDTTTAMHSFYSALTDPDQDHAPEDAKIGLHLEGVTMDLKKLPSAGQLDSMAPQTIIVNLLVAVIEIRPARTITLRSGIVMDIVEVIIGDETRAGFEVSIWLVPEQARHARSQALRREIQQLRPGNLAVFENIALRSFRNRVYGQTLPNRKTGTASRVILPERAKLPAALQTKAKLVSAWMANFIQQPVISRQADALPPETPDL